MAGVGAGVAIVLALRFATELALFGAIAWSVWEIVSGLVAIPLAVALVGAAMAVWGVFIAPRARHRLPDPVRFFIEVDLFVVGGLLVFWAGSPSPAIALVAAGTIAAIGVRLVGGEPLAQPPRGA